MPLPTILKAPLAKLRPVGPSAAPSHASDKLTSARRTDQDHADLLGGERATELPGFESLYARLEPLELGVEALDFILDDTHGGWTVDLGKRAEKRRGVGGSNRGN